MVGACYGFRLQERQTTRCRVELVSRAVFCVKNSFETDVGFAVLGGSGSPPQVLAAQHGKRPGTSCSTLLGGALAYDRRAAYLRNIHKYRARALAYSALKSGRLQRQPCEVCGATRVETHHEDYSKPLVVRWLCRPHHTLNRLCRCGVPLAIHFDTYAITDACENWMQERASLIPYGSITPRIAQGLKRTAKSEALLRENRRLTAKRRHTKV